MHMRFERPPSRPREELLAYEARKNLPQGDLQKIHEILVPEAQDDKDFLTYQKLRGDAGVPIHNDTPKLKVEDAAKYLQIMASKDWSQQDRIWMEVLYERTAEASLEDANAFNAELRRLREVEG